MENAQLASLLGTVLSDWEFIDQYIDDSLAVLKPLLPAEGLQDLFKRFRDEVYGLGVPVRLKPDYVERMAVLLVEKFIGWDTEKFDKSIWRLLHEDVLATPDLETRRVHLQTARFWLRVLSAIAEDDIEVEWQHDYDLSSDPEPQTTNLRAHALSQLAGELTQLMQFALRNKGVEHAWDALNNLAHSMQLAAQYVKDATEITVNDDLNENWLLEWIVINTEDGYDVNGYEANELKKLLLESPHNRGRTLSAVVREDREGLRRLCEDAKHNAESRERDEVDDD